MLHFWSLAKWKYKSVLWFLLDAPQLKNSLEELIEFTLGDLSVVAFKKALLFQEFRNNNLEDTDVLNDFSRLCKKNSFVAELFGYVEKELWEVA